MIFIDSNKLTLTINIFNILMYNRFFKFCRSSSQSYKFSRLSILLLAPVVISMPQYHSFFWKSKKANDLKQRVYIGTQVSNKPCEDRSSTIQLTAISGYAFAVFDGHGGWQVSHLCSKMLLETLDKQIFINKNSISDQEQMIKKSLRDAFEIVQNHFYRHAVEGYKLGFGKFARAGSCALVCVVVNNKIYSANAGDSLGLIIQKDKNNRMKFVELNQQLNANRPEERQRLRQLFPNEEDIVICKRENNTACYVKGRLQPTRSLGDLRLKHAQFNNPEGYSPSHQFQSPLKKFTGPYITWQPEIMVFPIQKTYKAIVLASDGLWDEVQRQQAAQLFKSNPIKQMPNILVQRALQKAAKAANLTVPKMKEIPAGKKRKIHDDITVVVVDLQSQLKS